MFKLWSIPENLYIFFSGIYSTLSLTIITDDITCGNVGVMDVLLLVFLVISSILLILIGSYLHIINEKCNLRLLSLDIQDILDVELGVTSVCPESDTLSLFKIREKENINAEKDSYWYSSVNIGCKKITHSKLLIILNISVLVLTIFFNYFNGASLIQYSTDTYPLINICV